MTGRPRSAWLRHPDWPPLTSTMHTRVPDDLIARVARLADEAEVPAGEIVRRALRDYLERHDIDPAQTNAAGDDDGPAALGGLDLDGTKAVAG